jgi:hypothetical protein
MVILLSVRGEEQQSSYATREVVSVPSSQAVVRQVGSDVQKAASVPLFAKEQVYMKGS